MSDELKIVLFIGGVALVLVVIALCLWPEPKYDRCYKCGCLLPQQGGCQFCKNNLGH